MSDLQWYPRNLNLIKNVKNTVVFLINYFCEFLLLMNKKSSSNFNRETIKENEQLKETKTLISNSYLIRQSFQVYCCKSDIANFHGGYFKLHYRVSQKNMGIQ